MAGAPPSRGCSAAECSQSLLIEMGGVLLANKDNPSALRGLLSDFVARGGHSDVASRLLQKICPGGGEPGRECAAEMSAYNRSYFLLACRLGDTGAAAWIADTLLGSAIPPGAEPLRLACEGNHLYLAEWLAEQTPGFQKIALAAFPKICEKAPLSMVAWAQRGGGLARGQVVEAVRHASGFGRLDVLHWMRFRLGLAREDVRRACELGAREPSALVLASAGGHLPVVEFLVADGVDFLAGDNAAFGVACAAGRLQLAAWLAEAGCPRMCSEPFASYIAAQDSPTARWLGLDGGAASLPPPPPELARALAWLDAEKAS